ncbi:MAG: hypothetical protein LBI69_00960 [Puniceicoccales bacterium]|jgi:hypothetical protein|nr:hypothetical protein [Puniceicoccales bacterium]
MFKLLNGQKNNPPAPTQRSNSPAKTSSPTHIIFLGKNRQKCHSLFYEGGPPPEPKSLPGSELSSDEFSPKLIYSLNQLIIQKKQNAIFELLEKMTSEDQESSKNIFANVTQIFEDICFLDGYREAATIIETIDFKLGNEILAMVDYETSIKILGNMHLESAEKFFEKMEPPTIAQILLQTDWTFGARIFMWMCATNNVKVATKILLDMLYSINEKNPRKAMGIFSHLAVFENGIGIGAMGQILQEMLELKEQSKVEEILSQLAFYDKKPLLQKIDVSIGRRLLGEMSPSITASFLAWPSSYTLKLLERIATLLQPMEPLRLQEILSKPPLEKCAADIQSAINAKISQEQSMAKINAEKISRSTATPPAPRKTRNQIAATQSDPPNTPDVTNILLDEKVSIGAVVIFFEQNRDFDPQMRTNILHSITRISAERLALILIAMGVELRKQILAMANSEEIVIILRQVYLGKNKQLACQFLEEMLDQSSEDLAKIINALVKANLSVIVNLFSQKCFTAYPDKAVEIFKHVSFDVSKLILPILLTLNFQTSINFLVAIEPYRVALLFEQLCFGPEQKNAANTLGAMAQGHLDVVVKIFLAMNWKDVNQSAVKIFSNMQLITAASILSQIVDQMPSPIVQSETFIDILMRIPLNVMANILLTLVTFPSSIENNEHRKVAEIMEIIMLRSSNIRIAWLIRTMNCESVALIFCWMCTFEKQLIAMEIFKIMCIEFNLKILETMVSLGGEKCVAKILKAAAFEITIAVFRKLFLQKKCAITEKISAAMDSKFIIDIIKFCKTNYSKEISTDFLAAIPEWRKKLAIEKPELVTLLIRKKR